MEPSSIVYPFWLSVTSDQSDISGLSFSARCLLGTPIQQMTNDTSRAAFNSCMMNRLVNFMPASLLATKLHFPQSRSNLMARPRLVRILEKGLHGPLTLISAPAGSGNGKLGCH